MSAAAAKPAPAQESGFWYFLDGCLTDGVGPAKPEEPKGARRAEKDQNDGMAAPTSMPPPALATAPLARRWGLEQPESPVATGDGQDFSSGLGPAPASALLAQWPATAGALARDPILPRDDLADGSREPTAAVLPELAFGARLFSLETATPRNGGAAAPSSTPAAFLPADTSAEGAPQDGSRTAENARSQPEDLEGSGTSRGANAQSGPQTAATSGNATSSSAGQEEDCTSPVPDPRNAGSAASLGTKGVAPSNEHPQGGGHGENTPPGQAETESSWIPAASPPASRDAQSADPAQETNVARPAAAEPTDPAAQTVSRDVSLHLADGESSVDIRMAERAGEIRVTVHTPDGDLANSLRAELPDLVGKLRQSGFQADAWRPAATAESEDGRRTGLNGSPSQERSPGGRKEERQPQPQHQQSKKQSRWAGEWKSSLSPAQESHT